MFKQISALILSLGLSANVFAADKINANLKKVSQKYRAAKVVEMNLEQSVKNDLTGKLVKSTGSIAIANEKFRIDVKTPDETLLMFDGTTLWNVQYPPKEFGGAPQVAKGKPDKKTRALMLAATLLGGDIQKTFKVTGEQKDGDIVTLSVASKDDLPVKNIQMVLDMKKQEIKEISYTDEIPNFVTMSFSEVKFKDSIKKNQFKYEIPKGAQVTNL